MNRLILGSSSLRRIEGIQRIGIPYHVLSMDFHEQTEDDYSADKKVRFIAEQKMIQLEQHFHKELAGQWVLTADTLVHLETETLGKPADILEAENMLFFLSGKLHHVTTAFCLKDSTGSKETFSDTTDVVFRKLDKNLVDFYLQLGEWKDAAGAYRIQESGDLLIDRINGSFSNVMGLPFRLLYDILLSKGFFENPKFSSSRS